MRKVLAFVVFLFSACSLPPEVRQAGLSVTDGIDLVLARAAPVETLTLSGIDAWKQARARLRNDAAILREVLK